MFVYHATIIAKREGLVNKKGTVLKGRDILQGIYLDGTAVAVTDEAAYEEDLAIQETIDSLTTKDDYSVLVGDAFVDLLNCPVGNTYSSLYPPYGHKLLYAYWENWNDQQRRNGTTATILPGSLDIEHTGGRWEDFEGRVDFHGWRDINEREYYIEQPNKFFMNLNV